MNLCKKKHIVCLKESRDKLEISGKQYHKLKQNCADYRMFLPKLNNFV